MCIKANNIYNSYIFTEPSVGIQLSYRPFGTRKTYFGSREVSHQTARSMESRELPQSASSPVLR